MPHYIDAILKLFAFIQSRILDPGSGAADGSSQGPVGIHPTRRLAQQPVRVILMDRPFEPPPPRHREPSAAGEHGARQACMSYSLVGVCNSLVGMRMRYSLVGMRMRYSLVGMCYSLMGAC